MRFARRASWLCLALASCARAGGHDLDVTTTSVPDRADAGAAMSQPDAEASAPLDDARAAVPLDAAAGADARHDASADAGGDGGVSAVSDASTCRGVGPNEACGISAQCGCGTAATCDITSHAGDTACVPSGIIPEGGYCTQTAGCQTGLTCRYGGTCHAFCSAPGAACTNGGTCTQVTDSADAGIPNFLVCERGCSLENADACGAGAGCFESQLTPGSTDCYQTGTHLLGDVCAYVNDCAAGLGCVSIGSAAATCKKWCRVGTNDCGGAIVCKGFTPQYMLNSTQYGFCP